MSDEASTRLTLETVIKEIHAGFASVREELSDIKKRLDIVESQLVQMDARNDRQESLFYQIRAEVLGLRADFKEFHSQFRAPA